jgi:hypothetical protein
LSAKKYYVIIFLICRWIDALFVAFPSTELNRKPPYIHYMKKTFLILSLFATAASAAVGQAILNISTVATGSRGFGDATGSARIMSTQGPAHLGGGNIAGVVPFSSGGTFNSTGDMIVGDAGDFLNFSLAMQFTTTAAFRSLAQAGNQIILTGTSLYGVDDGFGGTTVVTKGNVDWAPINVTLAGYGNSATGTFGDSNDFRPHAAFNGTDPETNSTNVNTMGPSITFDGDPYAGDTTFSVDVTSLFSSTGTTAALSASDDRVMLVLGAWNSDLSAIFSVNGVDDRIAFQPGSIQLTAVPEPSTYAAVLGLIAVAAVVYRRRKQS